jgi:hypothetical protein
MTAQPNGIGWVAECPNMHKRYQTVQAQISGCIVRLTCRCCSTDGRPIAANPTQPAYHTYEIDPIAYDQQGVTV